jgi:hypothetical protein
VREHDAKCDQFVIALSCLVPHALTQAPWSPATTTFPYLYLSFALRLGICRLPIPVFCTLFYCLVGLQTGKLCFCTCCRVICLWNLSTSSMVRVICIWRVLGCSGKPVSMSALPAYTPSCTDPPMLPSGAFSVSPTSSNVQ